MLSNENGRLTSQPRPLWLALAHCYISAPVGSPRADLLTRIYVTLNSRDRIRCSVEIRECREAMRGNREAKVS